MAMLNFMETSIPTLCSKALYDDKSYDVAANIMDQIATVYFNGVSYILRDAKSKEHPVAFVFESIAGDLYAGAVVRFIPNDDPDMPGSWSYTWTFDKEDIPNDARIITIGDSSSHSYFVTQASSFCMGFTSDAGIADIGNYVMKTISQWLQDNAKPDEEMGVKLEGVFEARCVVEDNEVVKSIELVGETKQIIKSDSSIEV